MSASLVGSEMCIRDRNLSAQKTTFGAADVRTCSWAACTCNLAPAACAPSCLLYTSDAADDM
eukprot:12531912-Alexandrium_andersonii.AAC.1